jgi:hypothetical protein
MDPRRRPAAGASSVAYTTLNIAVEALPRTVRGVKDFARSRASGGAALLCEIERPPSRTWDAREER